VEEPAAMREARAKAEENIGAELRDLMWRLRSTALNGNFPEMDGSEKPIEDVLEDARYAQGLAERAVALVEGEASARFQEVTKVPRQVEDVYERAKDISCARSSKTEVWRKLRHALTVSDTQRQAG
jgi:hypothetical protein